MSQIGSLTAAEAVVGQLGPQTMSSMARKGNSRALGGAGMATMVSMTKKAARMAPAQKKRQTGKSYGSGKGKKRATTRSRSPSPSTSTMLAGKRGPTRTGLTNYLGHDIWRTSGPKGREFVLIDGKRRAPKVAGARRRSGRAGPTKTGSTNYLGRDIWRTSGPKGNEFVLVDGKRRVPKVAGARAPRMSAPRMSAKARQTVAQKGCSRPGFVVAVHPNGKHVCVKPGSKSAKALLGHMGCPVGKELRTVRRSVAVGRVGTPGAGREIRMVEQCVRVGSGQAAKMRKECPVGQVLVAHQTRGIVGGGGALSGGGRRKPQMGAVTKHMCVKNATAAKRGYQVIKAGVLPPRGKTHATQSRRGHSAGWTPSVMNYSHSYSGPSTTSLLVPATPVPTPRRMMSSSPRRMSSRLAMSPGF